MKYKIVLKIHINFSQSSACLVKIKKIVIESCLINQQIFIYTFYNAQYTRHNIFSGVYMPTVSSLIFSLLIASF